MVTSWPAAVNDRTIIVGRQVAPSRIGIAVVLASIASVVMFISHSQKLLIYRNF